MFTQICTKGVQLKSHNYTNITDKILGKYPDVFHDLRDIDGNSNR